MTHIPPRANGVVADYIVFGGLVIRFVTSLEGCEQSQPSIIISLENAKTPSSLITSQRRFSFTHIFSFCASLLAPIVP